MTDSNEVILGGEEEALEDVTATLPVLEEDDADGGEGDVYGGGDGEGDDEGEQEDEDEGDEEDEDEGDEEDEDENGVVVDDDEFDDEDEDGDEDDEDGEGGNDEDDEDDEGGSSKKHRGGARQPKGRKAAKANAADAPEEEIQYGIDSDDEGDVEFEKFEEDTRDQYLLNFHPESLPVNFDEVKAMCTTVRDEDGDIVDPFHTTIPVMTKYEKARILGLRAKQLNSNIRPACAVPDYVIDSYTIAEMELERKVIPFIIRRPLPDGRSEYWRIEDLTCVY